MPYILLTIALTMNAFANLFMKIGATHLGNLHGLGISQIFIKFVTNWALILGVFLFATNVIFYIFALTKINISVAYPIMTAGCFLVITTFSVLFLKESLDFWQVVGIILVTVGITLIAWR